MSKVILNNVADLTQSTTAANIINANSNAIVTAFDNTLSRDGSQPNQMLSSLDMNSHQIINLPSPTTANSPLRLIDLNSFTGGGTGTSNIINVMSFGATGNGTTDDTAAIQAALNTGHAVYFPNPPGGFYNISSPLDIRNNVGQHLIGENSRKTKINQLTPNTQILRVGGNTLAGGAGQVIKGLWLQTNSEQPLTNTNAIGIELNQAFGSVFEDLLIYRTVTAIGINQSMNPNYAFSNTFNALWINNFSLRALDFRGVVAGSTGNVFLNIYCNNLKDDGVTRGSCTRAIEFAIHASTFLSVINVEDCAPSSDAVMFQQVRGGEVNALHFERVSMNSSSTSFLNIVDDQTNLVVNGVDVHFCEIGNAGQVGIIGYFGNPRAHITGVNTVSNTNNGTQFYLVSSIFGTTGAITITESNVSGTNGEQLVVVANPPVVKRVNLDWRHRTEGGNNILWGTAAPVSGTWAVGDKLYNTSPTTTSSEGFVCVSAGTPGTWQPFGIGAATGTSLTTTGAIVSTGTAGVGYATGAGGTVTQITSRTTGVTLNTICGVITLVSATGTNTPATFTVTNSTVANNDVVILSVRTGANTYLAYVSNVTNGSFNITVQAPFGTATEAPVINFAIIKAVIS